MKALKLGVAVGIAIGMPTLRRAVLADHATGPAFRYIEANLHVINRCPAACGA